MKYHKQLIQHDPDNGQYGDCFRTVIACLLDLEPESVPHVVADTPTDGAAVITKMNEFLFCMGLRFVEIPYGPDVALDVLLDTVGRYFKSNRYTLTGKSTAGCNHFVVCLGDKIEHNPNDAEIIGPAISDNGEQYWWIGFLVKVI